MIINNANVFLNGAFKKTDIQFSKAVEHIGSLPNGLDAEGMLLIPGLVDIHTHGAVGKSFCDGYEAFAPLAARLAKNGVTSFLATGMTVAEHTLAELCAAARRFRGASKCQGVNLEGPFISEQKAGAQDRRYIRAPDRELFSRLSSLCDIRLVTVAPEVFGAVEFIKHAKHACRVFLGHTAADYDTARTAFNSGATGVTHLYNAMPPLSHRAPAVIGAAVDAGAWAELICDGIHVHPSAVRAAFILFKNKVCLISDSIAAAGLPDGEYADGDSVIVVRDGRATLSDGTLAGSTITVLDALRNAVSFGIPLEAAVAAATINPARAAGIDGLCGSIAVGRAADLLLLNGDLILHSVFIDGESIAI